MPRRSCDGAGFLAAFRSAVASLEANVDEVNALNVFPVPDGDTGTNMLATVRGRARRGRQGRARGRRGADGPGGRLRRADGGPRQLGRDHQPDPQGHRGGPRRQAPVQRPGPRPRAGPRRRRPPTRPSPGRSRARSSPSSARPPRPPSPPPSATTTSRRVLAATVEAAERAVAKTPSLLPILREAHVVDSGGQGLFRLFQGALEAARRSARSARRDRGRRRAAPRPRGRRRARSTRRSSATRRSSSSAPGRAARWTSRRSRRTSSRSGESVLVAGDAAMAKVHVHNERPDAVIAYGLGPGRALADHRREPRRPGPRRPRGEGRRLRRRGRRRDLGPPSPPPPPSPRPAPRPRGRRAGPTTRPRACPLGVVAVAPSDGLAAVLDGHGRAVPRVRRVPDRPRRPGRQPVHGRAARGRPGHAGRRAPDPAQQPQRGPRRAPGRVDDRPAGPRRADAQRAPRGSRRCSSSTRP